MHRELPPPATPQTILEAMLFVGNAANEPLRREQAAAGMRGMSVEEIDLLVSELNAQYDRLGCPYTIVDDGTGLRLALRPLWHGLRQRFYGKIRRARLSQAAVDVLSIVAYQQPITRQQVDELRGRESGPLLRQLVRRRLLRVELPQTKGAPRAYCTTERFLELFGLRGLNDLPRGEELEIRQR